MAILRPSYSPTGTAVHEEERGVLFRDPKKLIDEILAPRYGNIWLVGGAMLGQSFLRLGLVDEIRLTIAPVLLGEGLRLFTDSGAETKWRLKT